MKRPKKQSILSRIFLILLLSAGPAGLAQPELGACDQELDEVAARQVPRAEEAWASGNMREAERYLKQGLSLAKDNADALYLLGHIEFRKGNWQYAEGLWRHLQEVCPDYKPMLYYLLGLIEASKGDDQKAIALYRRFLASPMRDRGLEKEVQSALAEAETRARLTADPLPFDPEVIPNVSTSDDEYLATISPDQQTLYFTRKSKKVDRKSGPAVKVRMVEEFTAAQRQNNGSFERGKPLPSPFNQNFNEGSPTITADNTEMYFTVCRDVKGYKNCDVFYTDRDALGYWTTPRSVGDHINRRNNWESQPTVSANGDLLIFASDRPEGLGGIDLYMCTRLSDDSWSRPVLLPKGINTPQDEKSPFLHPDNKTLYFTSNGLPGLGGYDIFMARRQDSTWASPQNIGFPINSEEDDLGLFVSLDGQYGYFSSNKLNRNGGWDLFRFRMPEGRQPLAVKLITGQLQSTENKSFEGASVKVSSLKDERETTLRVDQETGRFAGTIEVQDDVEDLIVSLQHKEVAFSASYLTAANAVGENTVWQTKLQFEPLEIGKEYRINDINFSSNSYILSPSGKKIVESFAQYLKDHPNLKADIQGHTDNVGLAADNLALSRNRARAVYEYLVSLGISQGRLSHHGYGETRPIADNESEEGKAANRRTVFVVTSY